MFYINGLHFEESGGGGGGGGVGTWPGLLGMSSQKHLPPSHFKTHGNVQGDGGAAKGWCGGRDGIIVTLECSGLYLNCNTVACRLMNWGKRKSNQKVSNGVSQGNADKCLTNESLGLFCFALGVL